WDKDLGNGFLREFQHAMKLGGLYTMLFHSDLLGAPENIHIVENVIESIRTKPAWIASGAELSEWWLNRGRLSAVCRMVNRHRVRIAITNRGENAVNGASVVVQLPYRPGQIRLIPAVHGRQLPAYRMLDGQEAMQLDFPSIPGRSSHIYLVSLNEQ
ncbi:MAG: hypothetical protein U0Q16_31645, partial [Bryobacteraceae bacterium]